MNSAAGRHMNPIAGTPDKKLYPPDGDSGGWVQSDLNHLAVDLLTRSQLRACSPSLGGRVHERNTSGIVLRSHPERFTDR